MENITVFVNDQSVTVKPGSTVRELLDSLNRDGRIPAIWINGKSVLQREHDSLQLSEGDRIRLVRISGGG